MLSIKVPPLGESVVEATVGRWLKKEGEAVQSGETIVELETDKINVEVPALRAGVLRKRAKNEGDVVKVDEVLGELDETAAAPAKAPPAEAGAGEAPSREARRAADDEGVDLSKVSGSGRGGVVSKPDVIEQRGPSRTDRPAPAPDARPVAQRPAARPSPDGDGARETRERMSTRRRRIAEHLLEAKQSTASLTTFNEADMSALMQLRERFRDKVEKEHGVKLTYMPFFVKAACMALKDFPVANAQMDGDSIVYRHYVNMGIAVASDQGLIVPNIRDADRKGIIELSSDIAALAKRARDGKLTMEDLTGGTFTITNGGVFGSLVSTPILNHPQVAILGLHKIQDRPVVVDGAIVARPMMYLAVTYDHRIIDGQQAVLFLVRIRELLEDPAAMVIS